MKRIGWMSILGLGFFLVFSCTIALKGEQNQKKILAPYFFIKGGDPAIDRLPLKDTRVQVNICGVMAEVKVMQRYTNTGNRPIHARYIFPGSTRAAVHGMKMTIGNKIIKAKIMKKAKARQTFEKAKKAGKSASLLEQHRPNVFSMNMANILPGDTIDVELEYTQFLIPAHGTYEFVFPTVVGPRYSNVPEGQAGKDDQWLKNPYFKKGEEGVSLPGESEKSQMRFDISTHLSAGLPIQEVACTTHQTDISFLNRTAATLTLKEIEKTGANRDYIVRFRLADKKIASGLMLHRGKTENFFALMVEPPLRINTTEIPNREYIFVVDVSGSMRGFPLNISKQLLRDLITNLRPRDTFNVLLFAGRSALMSERSIAANAENLQRAINLINRQRGGGGTELLRALKRAIQLSHDEENSRTIVVVTDGYVSFENSIFSYIRQNLNNANLYAFGIGSSVNRFLIEGMAKSGYGEPFVITESREAAAKAGKFRQYIQSPLLTNISVQYQDFAAYEVEPSSIPDLFAERPMVIFGKWRGKPCGSITVSGITGTGKFEKSFSVSDMAFQESHKVLKYLWARTRIADLSDFYFNKQNQETIDKVTELGLTYNLLTKHTSFVAVYEKIRNTEGQAHTVKQPLPLPKGVPNSAVGKSIIRGSEPSFFSLILMSLIMVFLFIRKKQLVK